MSKIKIYHGSVNLIPNPEIGLGKANNDYGKGFYCTKEKPLACEWASKSVGSLGYVNEYELDTSNLKILDLTKSEYQILHWMALLLNNRHFSLNTQINETGRDFLLGKYLIDVSEYDLIIGYRADDSYFSFAEDFLNNTITVEQLGSAMELGKLGLQQVLISQKAFNNLKYNTSELVDNQKYNSLYILRDCKARDDYKNSKNNNKFSTNGRFLIDIIREEENDDTSI